MIINVTLKDPDTLYDAVIDAIEKELSNLPEDGLDALKDIRQEKIGAITSKWFEYGEYVTLKIDTDAKTCVVVTVEELEKARQL